MAGRFKRVLLHVGPHKTGTTYLQRCLAARRVELKARGFVLPAAWERHKGDPSHTVLARAIAPGGALERVAEILDQGSEAGGDTLLASAEDLSTASPEALLRLKHALGDLPVQVIFYVRRWSDLLPSYWQELVEQGSTLSLAEFLYRQLRNLHVSREINLEVPLQPWLKLFGEDCVRLVSYTVLQERQINLFRHFAASFLDWPDAVPPQTGARPNASRETNETELLRQLNALEFRASGRRTPAIRDMYMLRNLREAAGDIFEAMQKSTFTMLFHDSSPPLQQLHGDLHRKFAGALVPPCRADGFFRPAHRKITCFSTDYLLQPGIAEAIRQLHASAQP